MNELLLTNIFFIITSAAVVLFTIITCVILYQIYKIVHAIRRIVDRVEKSSELIQEDLEELRNNLSFKALLLFAQRFFTSSTKRNTRQHSHEEE